MPGLLEPRFGAIGAETNSAPTRNPAAQAGPARSETLHFAVSRYELMGNTLLPDKALAGILSRHTGTNITFDDVSKAVKELQLEYHNRGYDTVKGDHSAAALDQRRVQIPGL